MGGRGASQLCAQIKDVLGLFGGGGDGEWRILIRTRRTVETERPEPCTEEGRVHKGHEKKECVLRTTETTWSPTAWLRVLPFQSGTGKRMPFTLAILSFGDHTAWLKPASALELCEAPLLGPGRHPSPLPMSSPKTPISVQEIRKDLVIAEWGWEERKRPTWPSESRRVCDPSTGWLCMSPICWGFGDSVTQRDSSTNQGPSTKTGA